MTNFLTTMRLFSTHDTYHGLATNIMEASVAVFLGSGFHEVSLLSFPFFAVNGIAATAVDAALRPVAEGAMPSACPNPCASACGHMRSSSSDMEKFDTQKAVWGIFAFLGCAHVSLLAMIWYVV